MICVAICPWSSHNFTGLLYEPKSLGFPTRSHTNWDVKQTEDGKKLEIWDSESRGNVHIYVMKAKVLISSAVNALCS